MPLLNVFLTASGMADLLSELGTGITQILSWVGSVANTIVSTPILLLGVCFFAIGGAIGIFGRLLSKS